MYTLAGVTGIFFACHHLLVRILASLMEGLLEYPFLPDGAHLPLSKDLLIACKNQDGPAFLCREPSIRPGSDCKGDNSRGRAFSRSGDEGKPPLSTLRNHHTSGFQKALLFRVEGWWPV